MEKGINISAAACKQLATNIAKAANKIAKKSKKGTSAFLAARESTMRSYVKAIIIDSIQQQIKSPLFDERLLYSDKEWRASLSSSDLKYIKNVLFDALLEKPIDEYAKGIQSTNEKIELVHSILKSMYREQQNFINNIIE